MGSNEEAESIALKALARSFPGSLQDESPQFVPHPSPKTAQSIRTILKQSFWLAIVCWVCAPPFTDETRTEPDPPPIIKAVCTVSTVFNMALLLRLVTTNKNPGVYSMTRSAGHQLPHSARLSTILLAAITVVLWMVAAANVGLDLRNQISILTPGPETNVDGEKYFWHLYYALVGGFLLVFSFYILAFTLQAILVYRIVSERRAFAKVETRMTASVPS